MEILIGIVLALGLLWAWLTGHWFARVVMFLALTGILGGIIGATLPPWDVHTGISPLGFPIAGIAAWFLAGIPTYLARRAYRQTHQA
jgi:hypothetical protein